MMHVFTLNFFIFNVQLYFLPRPLLAHQDRREKSLCSFGELLHELFPVCHVLACR